jgi:hypothetical protein
MVTTTRCRRPGPQGATQNDGDPVGVLLRRRGGSERDDGGGDHDQSGERTTVYGEGYSKDSGVGRFARLCRSLRIVTPQSVALLLRFSTFR